MKRNPEEPFYIYFFALAGSDQFMFCSESVMASVAKERIVSAHNHFHEVKITTADLKLIAWDSRGNQLGWMCTRHLHASKCICDTVRARLMLQDTPR